MNYYYITGTSRGIGLAVVKKLLHSADNFVTGISRGKSVNHERYKHITLDLNNLDDVKKLNFESHPDADKIVLINNSAVLGDVKRLGNLAETSITESYNVNIIAPVLLMNKFINTYQIAHATRIVMNISSGAARYPIASWSTYCSTKAALDMISEVANKEQIEKYHERGIKIFSVAPGIIDTKLQEQIREVTVEDFSKADVFRKYKTDNQLDNPDQTAQSLIKIILNSSKFLKVCLDVREL